MPGRKNASGHEPRGNQEVADQDFIESMRKKQSELSVPEFLRIFDLTVKQMADIRYTSFDLLSAEIDYESPHAASGWAREAQNLVYPVECEKQSRIRQHRWPHRQPGCH